MITGGVSDAVFLESEEAYVRARTGGEAKVRASKFIEARSSTGGQIYFRGNPQKTDLGSSLGGTVEFR